VKAASGRDALIIDHDIEEFSCPSRFLSPVAAFIPAPGKKALIPAVRNTCWLKMRCYSRNRSSKRWCFVTLAIKFNPLEVEIGRVA